MIQFLESCSGASLKHRFADVYFTKTIHLLGLHANIKNDTKFWMYHWLKQPYPSNSNTASNRRPLIMLTLAYLKSKSYNDLYMKYMEEYGERFINNAELILATSCVKTRSLIAQEVIRCLREQHSQLEQELFALLEDVVKNVWIKYWDRLHLFECLNIDHQPLDESQTFPNNV